MNKPQKPLRTKKVWAAPQLFLINQAHVAGGAIVTAHEAGFTPKHTNYAPNGAGPFPTSVFFSYIS
jgi:hypothetical protein